MCAVHVYVCVCEWIFPQKYYYLEFLGELEKLVEEQQVVITRDGKKLCDANLDEAAGQVGPDVGGRTTVAVRHILLSLGSCCVWGCVWVYVNVRMV